MEDTRTLCPTTVGMGKMEGEYNTARNEEITEKKKTTKNPKNSVCIFFNESLTLKADMH